MRNVAIVHRACFNFWLLASLRRDVALRSWLFVPQTNITIFFFKAELINAADGEFIVHDSEDSFAALTIKVNNTLETRRIVRQKNGK